MIDTPVKTLIVIPCLNEEAYLETLIDGLHTSCDVDTTHIVIADGGSVDRSPVIARSLAQRYPRVSYLHNPGKLQAAAVNLAVATYGADATFLIRIDSHADYPKNYCQTLIDEAISMDTDSVVVTMQTVGIHPFQKAVAAAQNSKLGNGGASHRSSGDEGRWVVHGHHALMRLDAFHAVGGYDESFAANEDAELDSRLIKAGKKIWLTHRTTMIYYPRSSPVMLFRQYFAYGYGRARTILKHKAYPKLRQLLPSFILPAYLLSLLALWIPGASLPLCLWLFLCLSYGFVLAWRARTISLVWAGPAILLMHAGWSLGFWHALLTSARKRA